MSLTGSLDWAYLTDEYLKDLSADVVVFYLDAIGYYMSLIMYDSSEYSMSVFDVTWMKYLLII